MVNVVVMTIPEVERPLYECENSRVLRSSVTENKLDSQISGRYLPSYTYSTPTPMRPGIRSPNDRVQRRFNLGRTKGFSFRRITGSETDIVYLPQGLY